MFRTVFTPKNESQLVITLPKECLNHKVEIISEDILEEKPDLTHEEKVKKAFVKIEHLRKDTTDFVFNREEANER